MSSSSGRLPAPLARALATRGFTDLTPIQHAVLDAAGTAADLMVSAPTGSGKTLAFGLALVPHLLDPEGRMLPGGGPRALVVAPTRDLAAQVAGELAWLYAGTAARVLLCTGGADRGAERAGLGRGADIVVGSPGRLGDHIAGGALVPGWISCLLLDEADELLERGFLAETRSIIAALPQDCRLVLCSATITPRLARLAADLRGGLAPRLVTAAGVEDRRGCMQAVAVPAALVRHAVAGLLRLHGPERALVFCRRRLAAAELADWLRASGFRAAGLTGALTLRERAAALAVLRDGRAAVCVATDIAARGLDLRGIGLVVHAGPPHSAEALVHRNGRAGRGGGPGLAVLVATPAERRRVEALARRVCMALDWVAAPDLG